MQNPKPTQNNAQKTYNRNRPARPPPPGEEHLLLPTPPSELSVVDTHTHVLSTFDFYRRQYRNGKYTDVYSFIKAMYEGRNVDAIVDVWCDAPVKKQWKEYADAAMDKEKWGGMEYWFTLGVHPHDAKKYNDRVENDILEAMEHPRCVGLGEIGLDYHYNHSPRDKQQAVFTQQLKLAVRLGKPLVIHTREADDDTERIMKAEVPKDHKIHVHCFSDTPEFGKRLLDHFSNLYIGITGVITYSSNKNTSAVVRNMAAPSLSPNGPAPTPESLRILLETDAPFMTPGNMYDDLDLARGQKLPLCHSAMIPWTAQFVADVANSARVPRNAPRPAGVELWSADDIMRVSRENTRKMYGVTSIHHHIHISKES
ncbi:hypothetical protein GALMADRAFT_251759 [Galerina marginata CBS 339.88]|uniref:Amidohydrolase-related domain-containing protein n=1 Tax=Galerina marginata (strain CBS 339.88) TaxID=685588 RepID=A0A067SQE2_GALM3|nr:hypothetical protein GALMADRAFT_251759 [Galerina marginata CBS 339.88]